METIMGKQMTFAEARARCHALGITPGRSLAECLRRVEQWEACAETARNAMPALRERHAQAHTRHAQAHTRRVRRVETIMGSLTGMMTVVRIMAPVGRGDW
jgi:hypothetical protein